MIDARWMTWTLFHSWRDVALLPSMIRLPWNFESMMFPIPPVLLFSWNTWNKVISTFYLQLENQSKYKCCFRPWWIVYLFRQYSLKIPEWLQSYWVSQEKIDNGCKWSTTSPVSDLKMEPATSYGHQLPTFNISVLEEHPYYLSPMITPWPNLKLT